MVVQRLVEIAPIALLVPKQSDRAILYLAEQPPDMLVPPDHRERRLVAHAEDRRVGVAHAFTVYPLDPDRAAVLKIVDKKAEDRLVVSMLLKFSSFIFPRPINQTHVIGRAGTFEPAADQVPGCLGIFDKQHGGCKLRAIQIAIRVIDAGEAEIVGPSGSR